MSLYAVALFIIVGEILELPGQVTPHPVYYRTVQYSNMNHLVL